MLFLAGDSALMAVNHHAVGWLKTVTGVMYLLVAFEVIFAANEGFWRHVAGALHGGFDIVIAPEVWTTSGPVILKIYWNICCHF